MKISNFEYIATKGKSPLDWKYFAMVDIEIGFLFWKKIIRRQVCRNYCGDWFFIDDGKLTPGFHLQRLARSFTAKTGIEV